MPPMLYYTVSAREIRPTMPAIPVLLSAASFTRPSAGATRLHTPQLPEHISDKGADSGGYTAVVRWGGSYRYRPAQYVTWLARWRPQWAFTMDLCCLDAHTRSDPGEEIVRRRQQFTTEMAQRFWLRYQDVPWCWCPVVQGYHLEQYEQHAHELAPLIRQMQQHYLDPDSGSPEEEEQESAFRVGIGTLARRLSAPAISEIACRIARAIGIAVHFHLLGTKLAVLKSPVALPATCSLDTGAWNGLFGYEHEARRASGLTVTDYSWQISQPRYAQNVQRALAAPKQTTFCFFQ